MALNPVESRASTFAITSKFGGVGKIFKLESSCQYIQSLRKHLLKHLYTHCYYFAISIVYSTFYNDVGCQRQYKMLSKSYWCCNTVILYNRNKCFSTKVSIPREKFFRVENKWLEKELLSKLLCLLRIYSFRKKKC